VHLVVDDRVLLLVARRKRERRSNFNLERDMAGHVEEDGVAALRGTDQHGHLVTDRFGGLLLLYSGLLDGRGAVGLGESRPSSSLNDSRGGRAGIDGHKHLLRSNLGHLYRSLVERFLHTVGLVKQPFWYGFSHLSVICEFDGLVLSIGQHYQLNHRSLAVRRYHG